MRRLVLTFLFIVTFTLRAHSQYYDTSPKAQTGRLPIGTYNSVEIDNVSVYNGNLSLDIPLFSRPGRELSTGLRLTYNAQKWQQYDFFGNPGGVYTGGWRIVDLMGEVPKFSSEVAFDTCVGGSGSITWRLKATWVDGVGSKRLYLSQSTSSCAAQADYLNKTYHSTNGDASVLIVGTDLNDLTMKFKDGNVIVFGTETITTSNGNYIQRYTSTHLPVQDTLGRANGGISYFSNFDPNNTSPNYMYYKRYTITDANGMMWEYTLNFKDNVPVHNPYGVGVGCSANAEMDGQLQSIVLPTMQQYSFSYESCQGMMYSVNLPTGGYIHYGYTQADMQSPPIDFVMSRMVSYDGMSEKTWNFNLMMDPGGRHVTVTSPEGDKVEHYFYDDTGGEYKTVWKDANGGMTRKTIDTVWAVDTEPNNGPYINARRTSVTTTMDNVKKRTLIGYDPQLNVNHTEDTDWGYGSPGMKIAEKNMWFTNDAQFPFPFQRVASIQLKGVNPINQVFEDQGGTEFGYDEAPVELCNMSCNVPNHVMPGPMSKRGNVTTIRRYKSMGMGVSETFRYDPYGNVVKRTDPRLHETTISYDDNFNGTNYSTHAFPTDVRDAQWNHYKTVYNYYTGFVTKTIDPRNKETVRTYDEMNRIKTITAPSAGQDPSTQSTVYTYDDYMLKVTENVTVNPGEVLRTETYFDKFYRPTRTVQIDMAGNVYVDTQYDGKSRVKQQSAPYRSGGSPQWTINAFDSLDRPTTVTNPDMIWVQYDYYGNTTTETDENNKQRRLTTNGLDQLIQVEEPNPTLMSPLTTTYANYVFGPIGKVMQSSQTRTFTRDWLGFLSSENHPESGTTTYTPYDNGLVYRRTDSRGIMTTYNYDNADRLQSITYSDGTPMITNTYDQCGQGLLCSTQDGMGTTTFTYSNAGLILSESRGFSGVNGMFTTSYNYDLSGRLKTITYPSGRTVSRTYEYGTNRLSTLRDDSISTYLVQSVTENAAGQLTTQILGGLAVENRSYNSRNQLTGISATRNSYYVLDFNYGYINGGANVGRIRSRTDNIQPEHSVNYTYDSIYRLTDVTAGDPAWSVNWVYDQYGNRTSQTRSGLASGRVATQTLGYFNNRNNAFTYDNAGNITFDGIVNSTFDAEGRMTSVNGVTYSYDGAGRRITGTSGGVSTYYLYGQTGLLSEFTTTNTGATGAASTNKLEYRIAEQTGTPVILMNSSGTVIENNRLLPFGEPWIAATGSTNAQKFTSYLRDPDTGSDYALSRWYAKEYGRFTSPDVSRRGQNPTNPQSWNLYLYVANEPIDYVDPLGFEIQDAGGGCTWDTDTNTLRCPPPPAPTRGIDPATQLYLDGLRMRAMQAALNAAGAIADVQGIRAPGQTYNECMAANANTYSAGGFSDLAISAARGEDTSFFSSRVASPITGNAINTLMYGNSVDLGATTYASGGAYVAVKAIGSPLTSARRPADIMSLNLIGKTGPAPRVLGQSTAGAKAMLGKLGNAVSFGLTFVERLTIDAAFTAGEAISCSLPR